MESHSQAPYSFPQPQSPPYYSYSQQPQPQPQQEMIYPQPQSNVKVVQLPPCQISSPMAMLPQNQGVTNTISSYNGSLQNNAASGMAVQRLAPPLTPNKVVNLTGTWTTGLFDCMEDPTNALITALFPCVTFGQIADVLDNGHATCATSGIIYAFAPCLVSGPYRKKLRQRFGLVEAPASDRIIHSLFEPCALCQEYRELNNRGINPALGHHGNLNKQQISPMMQPPRNQMMT
ncbi:hypothetical protein PTKIN_Ptkin17bG0168400 [Pterospermum kingtungense]